MQSAIHLYQKLLITNGMIEIATPHSQSQSATDDKLYVL